MLAAACDVESTAQARTASVQACLGLTAIAIQNAFDWFDPDISVGMGRRMINVVANLPNGLDTLSHDLADPPVTVMGRRAMLPPIALAALSRRLPTRGRHLAPIFATDLLS